MLLEKAKSLLSSGDTLALVQSLACDELTGGAHAAWETDSLLVFLEDQGCLPPDEAALDRLLAVTAVRANPAYLWDARVLENLSETLNGRVAQPESITGTEVGELCWTVVEMRLMAQHYEEWSGPQFYGDEPAVYAAALCATSGLVIVPPELAFAQDALDTMVPKVGREEELKKRTLELLGTHKECPYDEDDAACVHARVLMEVGNYVSTMRSLLNSQLLEAGVRL